ncbi:MAG: hypothetical protein ACXWZ1_10825 [Gaiellaceae bacterium]
MLAALGALLPAWSGAASNPTFIHDIKVFHQVASGRSTPWPAQVALLVGGKAEGKLVPGLKGQGKQFAIVDVAGAEVAWTRNTGSRARISLDVASPCRANPTERYYLRATAVIRGKSRRAFVRGDCDWVVQVLAHDAQALVNTTFIFEN